MRFFSANFALMKKLQSLLSKNLEKKSAKVPLGCQISGSGCLVRVLHAGIGVVHTDRYWCEKGTDEKEKYADGGEGDCL